MGLLTVPRGIRRALILTHRYLGIPLSVLFVVWFASGIVMMYAPTMPGLTPDVRLELLEPIDFSLVRLDPADALDQSGLVEPPLEATLFTVLGRPAYRFGAVTVFADNGENLRELDRDGTWRVATRFAGVHRDRVELVRVLTAPDQWTIGLNRLMPLHRYRVDDEAGTELYVSARRAEVVVVTTRWSRLLAWFGAIPHWLYFSALRTNGALWSRVVIWLSTLGCVVALIGLVLGVTELRRRQDGAARRARGQGPIAAWIPYAGAMRWHHVTGLVFGLFTFTWVFSGLLSMEPYGWTRVSGLEIPPRAMSGGYIDELALSVMDVSALGRLTAGRPVKEVEFLRIHGDPYFAVTFGPRDRILVSPETMTVRRVPFTTSAITTRLALAVPEAPIEEATVLDSYDAYYYARGGARPLPVVRVKFSDSDRTWVYVDMATSRIVGSVHRWSRVERWLYRGLHSLDFAFWYDRRPLWDIGLIALSIGGLVSSGLGLWLGAGRIGRWTRSRFRRSRRTHRAAS